MQLLRQKSSMFIEVIVNTVQWVHYVERGLHHVNLILNFFQAVNCTPQLDILSFLKKIVKVDKNL